MYHTRVLLALELRVSRSMERNRVVAPILQLLRLFSDFLVNLVKGFLKGLYPPLSHLFGYALIFLQHIQG